AQVAGERGSTKRQRFDSAGSHSALSTRDGAPPGGILMERNATWRQVVGVAKFSAVGTAFVMAIAMATSYTTQVMLLLAHDVQWASWAVPLTIDVLALMSNLALGLPHRKGYGRKGLWFILTVTLSVSMTLNFMAGSNFIA